jgi:recombination protein RecA
MSTRPDKQLLPYSQVDLPYSGEAVPTGSLGLDVQLGTGGWPRGHVVEIFAKEGAGKTTLLLTAIARAQRKGGCGAFLDADHGMRPATAARLGIDLDRMLFHRPSSLEDAFEKIDELVRKGSADVIALDSIASLLPEERRHDDDPPTQDEKHQRCVEHFLRAILGPLSRSRAVLLVSNQVKDKVGVMFGNPETTPWETLPLRDFASQRVELRRSCVLRDGPVVEGAKVKAKVLKNRFAPPFGQAEFELRFATGLCEEAELVWLGLDAGVVTKADGCLCFGDSLLGKGELEAVCHLRQDADTAARLREGIRERLRPPGEARTPGVGCEGRGAAAGNPTDDRL